MNLKQQVLKGYALKDDAVSTSSGVVWILLPDITTTTTVLRPFFRDHPDEPVPEENFWTLWCKERSTEADNGHPAGRHSILTNQCPPPLSPIFKGRMPFRDAQPTVSKH